MKIAHQTLGEQILQLWYSLKGIKGNVDHNQMNWK